jgi:hypothetical protein
MKIPENNYRNSAYHVFMRNVLKISLLLSLLGWSDSLFHHSEAKPGWVSNVMDVELPANRVAGESLTHTKRLPFFLAEFQTECGSELEPKAQPGTVRYPDHRSMYTGKEYLKFSRGLIISLSNRERLFPFHSHL